MASHDELRQLFEGAQMIGADCYSPDAMDTVRYAEKFYQE